MKIAGGVIYHYLNLYLLNEDWSANGGVEEYYEAVMNLKHDASVANDLEPLRLSVDYILCHPEIDTKGLVDATWSDKAIREAIKYIRKIVYSDAPPVNCNEVKSVTLLPMNVENWWKMRTEQGLHPDLSKQQA